MIRCFFAPWRMLRCRPPVRAMMSQKLASVVQTEENSAVGLEAEVCPTAVSLRSGQMPSVLSTDAAKVDYTPEALRQSVSPSIGFQPWVDHQTASTHLFDDRACRSGDISLPQMLLDHRANRKN